MEHLHRFFVRRECVNGGKVHIDGPDARQIVSVLRLGPGDRITALDGTGRALMVRISEATPTRVTGNIEEARSLDVEPRVKLTIAQSLPKGDKLEFVIQKGTELGVARFEIIATARTVAWPPRDRIARRLERWRAIAKEAAEQSFRGVIPEVVGITPLDEFLPRIADFDLAICLWEDENENDVRKLLQQNRAAESILVMVGPEGGFPEEEVRKMEAAGARAASLGRRILRCETAAIAAAAVLFYELD